MNRPSFHFVHFADGQDIVIEKYSRPTTYEVATVRLNEDRQLASLEIANGETVSVQQRSCDNPKLTSTDGTQWGLYFTLPLPKGTDEERIDYARTLRGEPARAPFGHCPTPGHVTPSAFLVESADDEFVAARMVSKDRCYAVKDLDGVEILVFKSLDEEDIVNGTRRAGEFWMTEDRAIIRRCSLADAVEAGDVLLATDIRVSMDDNGAITELSNAYRLPFKATPETLDRVFPTLDVPPDDRMVFPLPTHIDLECVSKWLFERECAKRRSEPVAALIVSVPDRDNPGADSERIGILAHKGELIYRNFDYVHEGLVTSGGIQPGIALMTGINFWSYTDCSTGEHDAGFDFSHEYVGEETLDAFGIGSASELGKAIRGFLEDDEDSHLQGLDDGELARHFLALAKTTSEPAAAPAP